MPLTPTAFHWSGGKDSALALSRLLAAGTHSVECLVTTINPQRNTSTVHGIPVPVMEEQARCIGLPLRTVEMTGPAMEDYVEVMADTTQGLRDEGIEAFAFGDLSASDVRRLKEEQFRPFGIEVVVPLWGMSSRDAVEAFIDSGHRAVTVVVDADALDVEHVGRELDRDYLASLPDCVDPAGELGEYHSFTYAGPLFREPVAFTLDEPFHHEVEVGTNQGRRRYRYWLSTPQLPA